MTTVVNGTLVYLKAGKRADLKNSFHWKKQISVRWWMLTKFILRCSNLYSVICTGTITLGPNPALTGSTIGLNSNLYTFTMFDHWSNQHAFWTKVFVSLSVFFVFNSQKSINGCNGRKLFFILAIVINLTPCEIITGFKLRK